jgi:ribosomal protein S18 acetylase RimI-like enzyme
MLDEIIKQLHEYEIATITRQNFENIFEIYDTNQDFFMLVQNKKATIESSIHDVDALPPRCGVNQKIYISIWEDSNVIGVLDLITGYPGQTDFWIGLLLVHGNRQGEKIGSKIINAVLKAAKAMGYKSAQLGVIENNVKSVSFWQKHGFGIFGHKQNIVVMTRDIM